MVSDDKITLQAPFTLASSAKRWGAERIVLDGVQNHLPGDTGGKTVRLKFLVGGKWRPLSDAPATHKIERIEFEDDGRGFDYRKLGIIYSDKPDDVVVNGNSNGAAGEFGEGLKLITNACLRSGIHIQIRSRDWQATPRVEKIPLDGKIVNYVFFDVETGLPAIEGSRTTFSNPSRELIENMLAIEKKVLLFRPNYSPIYSGQGGNRIADDSGDIFVKGIFITSSYRKRTLFGYDLNLDNLPRDRDHVEQDDAGNAIGKLLAECNDPRIIHTVLSKTLDGKSSSRSDGNEFLETRYIPTEWKGNSGYGRDISHPEIWKKAFSDIFGASAVVASGREYDQLARLAGYEVIAGDYSFCRFLGRCGIGTSESVANSEDSFLTADVDHRNGSRINVKETDIGLSYRASKWGKLRIALDAVSNHLPQDSGASSVKIEFKVYDKSRQVYKWVSADELEQQEIANIRIVDNGKGYDSGHLAALITDKTPGSGVGQFGEGLKLLSTAALRLNIKVKFESRDWVAQPFSGIQKLDGKDRDFLCYRILSGVSPRSGSATTFGTVDRETADIFKKLDDFVLPLRIGFKPEFSCASGSLFCEDVLKSVPNGSVFNKGVFITNEHANRALFSYNVNTEDISPDRDGISIAALQASVTGIISECANREIISTIITAANKHRDSPLLEFVDIHLPDHIAQVWKEAFYSLYGQNAVLETGMSSGMEAKHQGFEPIKLNTGIENMLHRAGVEYDREVITEGLNAHYVPLEELSAHERAILGKFVDVEAVLGLQNFDNVKVFDKVCTSAGRDLTAKRPGFWDGESINIRRDMLSSLVSAVDVYKHERGHKETGAGDPDDKFRDFFENYLTAFLCMAITQPQTAPTNIGNALPISFSFDGATVQICPKDGVVDGTMLRIMEEAALGKKKSFDRALSWLFGKQTWVEQQVSVKVIRPDNATEMLNDKDKIALLRKVARSNRLEGGNTQAAQAINQRKSVL
ncbi:MAG: hypothetical protein NTX79_02775 [Candidatus Micrarchaeota archaeon]|nr:hypothetical protein [Candidatus Micrarchaeota archaeon]